MNAQELKKWLAARGCTFEHGAVAEPRSACVEEGAGGVGVAPPAEVSGSSRVGARAGRRLLHGELHDPARDQPVLPLGLVEGGCVPGHGLSRHHEQRAGGAALVGPEPRDEASEIGRVSPRQRAERPWLVAGEVNELRGLGVRSRPSMGSEKSRTLRPYLSQEVEGLCPRTRPSRSNLRYRFMREGLVDRHSGGQRALHP